MSKRTGRGWQSSTRLLPSSEYVLSIVLVFEALGLGKFKADPVLPLCSSPSLFGVLNVIKSPVYFQPLTNRVAPGAGLRDEGTAFSPPPASTHALSYPLIPGLLPPLAVFRSLRVRAMPAVPVGRSHPSPLPHQEPRPARLDGNVVRGARTRTEASKGDGMYQGAVLGPRRGRFQRVPASSRWLWAHLEGGSLTPQLPHLHGLSFPTGVPLSSSKTESRSRWWGVQSLTAKPAAFISNLPKPEF